ncbi:hypothetical protein ACVWYH_004387 [Bradyrhizobium sp. GM24.11]
MTHYKHTEPAGKSAFALHQRLAHALESLTWHMVQRKLQRLTFAMSSLIGGWSTTLRSVRAR